MTPQEKKSIAADCLQAQRSLPIQLHVLMLYLPDSTIFLDLLSSPAHAHHRFKPHPPPGQCWFEFNDTRVSPIMSQAMDKMFQGKQSAYMLFYRKASAKRPTEGTMSYMLWSVFKIVMSLPCAYNVIAQTTYNIESPLDAVCSFAFDLFVYLLIVIEI